MQASGKKQANKMLTKPLHTPSLFMKTVALSTPILDLTFSAPYNSTRFSMVRK